MHFSEGIFILRKSNTIFSDCLTASLILSEIQRTVFPFGVFSSHDILSIQKSGVCVPLIFDGLINFIFLPKSFAKKLAAANSCSSGGVLNSDISTIPFFMEGLLAWFLQNTTPGGKLSLGAMGLKFLTFYLCFKYVYFGIQTSPSGHNKVSFRL